MLGARGWRLLDDLAFACEVVALDEDATTVDVRYCDDGRVEQRVDLLEFVTSCDPHEQQQQQEEELSLPTTSDWFEHLVGSDQGAALDAVAMFLDHVEWLRGLARVSRRWRQQLLRRSLWRTVRVPRAADAGTPTAFASACRLLESVVVYGDASESDDGPHARVCDVVEELALSGSAVTDDQVLQLIQRCGSSLTRVALRGCSRVSFLLLYELTRLAKQPRPQPFALHVDVWLCRGISPAYVRQLREHGAFERAGLRVQGPGFAVMEVSAGSWEWVEREAAVATTSSQLGGAGEGELLEPTCFDRSLALRFVPRSRFSTLFEEQLEDAQGGDHAGVSSAVARELRGGKDLMEKLRLTMIPLVRLDRVLGATEASGGRYALVGMPATPGDLLRLARQHAGSRAELQLSSALHQLASPAPKVHPELSERDAPAEPELSLEARADKAFAMLRQTTTDLAAQVAHLERQVQQLTLVKRQAQQEYVDAQLELERIAKEADRALLSLATSSTVLPPPPPSRLPMASEPFVVEQRAGDELLPALPSDEQLRALGAALQHSAFAVLDDFVGAELSASVYADLERMYSESRRVTHDTSSASPRGGVVDASGREGAAPPSPAGGAFQLGELAGGNTGRNLRYKLQHVRGDYVLWLDEHDAFCPRSVQRVLRQLDRLVLERLPAHNAELRASSLLRKKAMATCYPGSGARYTRHCDNPNRNGRKLTAILYLNAHWTPRHGGELQLHVLPPPQNESSGDGVTKVVPLLDRLLLFFSDRRVPHEVLPCRDRDRFALTVWYLDYDEFMNAQVFGAVLQDECEEERRIQREVDGFLAAKEASEAAAATLAATTEL